MTLKSTKVLVEYDENQIDKALLFLKTSIYETDNVNTYTLALCLYAFKLSEIFMDNGEEKANWRPIGGKSCNGWYLLANIMIIVLNK